MEYDEHGDAGSQASVSSGLGLSEYAPQELPEGLEVQVASTMKMRTALHEALFTHRNFGEPQL